MSAPNPGSTSAPNPIPKPSGNSRPSFRPRLQQTCVAQATGTNPHPGHHVTCPPSAPIPDPQHPETRDICVESETFIDVSDRNPTEGTRAVTDSQSLNPRPRPHTPPSRMCDIVGLSTLVPLRGHSDGPQMCDRMGQSETFADVSYPNLNREPRGSIESRSTVHYSLRPMSDTLPSKICDNTGQSETFADSPTPNTPASPAHRSASDSQLLTSNSQLLASTSTPRRTCDNTGQSETFADSPNPNTPASPADRPATTPLDASDPLAYDVSPEHSTTTRSSQ